MDNLLLPIFAAAAYCYGAIALLFLICGLAIACRTPFPPSRIAALALSTTLYAQAWLGGAAVILVLWLSGNLAMLSDALTGTPPHPAMLLLKATALTVLVQCGARWERRYRAQKQPPRPATDSYRQGFRYWLFFANLVVATPLLEELVFRYLFLARHETLAQAGVALLISAALFSWIHRKTYGTYFVAGLLLGLNFDACVKTLPRMRHSNKATGF